MSLLRTQDNKYLGVQIGEHLTCKKHVDLIPMKVSRATAMLRYVSNILPQPILKIYTPALQNPIVITAPRYGGAVVRLKLIGFRNCRTEQFG